MSMIVTNIPLGESFNELLTSAAKERGCTREYLLEKLVEQYLKEGRDEKISESESPDVALYTVELPSRAMDKVTEMCERNGVSELTVLRAIVENQILSLEND